MSIKNFLGSIIKKQIAIDVSNSGLLINNGWCFKKYDTTLDVPIIDIKES